MTKCPIPKAALAQHIAVLGKTRSGKSTVMRDIFEYLLGQEEPACVIDPKGDWWGLKVSADGKGPGFPLVVFGGAHADVPINEHAGAQVAELFATGNRPCIVDLGGWTVGARTRFWIAFAETLFRLNKGQRWLFVDEVHNFAPKGQVSSPDAGMALHWTNRLASEGLGRGINMVFASQRPQKVHNDTLTSAETLIAMRVSHTSDRKAIAEWMEGAGDDALANKVLKGLAQLEKGEGWVWSPEIKFGPELVKFPMFTTYDSFRPQTEQDAKRLKGWAEVNLDEVKAALVKSVAEAEANDPKRLRAENARLARELEQAKKSAPNPQALAEVELRGRRALAAETAYKLREMQQEVTAARQFIGVIEVNLGEWAKSLADEQIVDAEFVAHAATHPTAPKTTPTPVAKSRPMPGTAGDHAGAMHPLSKAERALLTVLAQRHPKPVTRVQLGLFSDYSPKSSTFQNAMSSLRTGGYATGGGDDNRITEAGADAIGPVPAPLEGRSLLEQWLAKLGKAERTLLEIIYNAYPVGVPKAELSEKSGYSQNSSTFQNAVSRLRTLGLITRDAAPRITGEFFE